MKKKITGLILLAVGLAICIFAGYKIIDINREYKFSRELYSREKDRYFISESNKSILEKYNSVIDFSGLKKENNDICGWISIPSISVDYPILQGESNDTYLRHLPDGTYNVGGSIFIDENCKNDFSSGITIIYGHYMYNGTMFGGLNKFLNDSFLKCNDYFNIFTPEKDYNAHILACFETKSSSPVYDLPDENDLDDYFKQLSKESGKNFSLFDVSKEKIIILSTCSHSFESARTVLVASIKK